VSVVIKLIVKFFKNQVDKVSSGMPSMINEDKEMKNNAVMNQFNKMNNVDEDKSEKKDNEESALAQDVNLENEDTFKDA
jgi:hypothetical protein